MSTTQSVQRQDYEFSGMWMGFASIPSFKCSPANADFIGYGRESPSTVSQGRDSFLYVVHIFIVCHIDAVVKLDIYAIVSYY